MYKKIGKKYALIPKEKLDDFMRLFPTARLHAWPNTWSFSTTLKPEVDAFLAADVNAKTIEPIEDLSAPLDEAQPPSPTDRRLSITLSAKQIHALEYLLRRIADGTMAAVASNVDEKELMRSSVHTLRWELGKALESPKRRLR